MWLGQLEMCMASGAMFSEGLWKFVWWGYVRWFPFYITCDNTFRLALILLLLLLLLSLLLLLLLLLLSRLTTTTITSTEPLSALLLR